MSSPTRSPVLGSSPTLTSSSGGPTALPLSFSEAPPPLAKGDRVVTYHAYSMAVYSGVIIDVSMDHTHCYILDDGDTYPILHFFSWNDGTRNEGSIERVSDGARF